MREPGALDALRVLALALVAVAGASLLAASAQVTAEAAGVILQISFFAIPLGYAKAAKLRPWAANGYVAPGWRPLVLVLIASLGSLWLLNGLSQLQTPVLRSMGFEEQAQQEEQHLQQSLDRAKSQGVVSALSLLVLIPPLCEETFFRGILFRGLVGRFGVGVALALTSLLFSWFHPTIIQKVLMFSLGCYFGAVVYFTGSLWAGVLAHTVNNFAVVSLSWIYGEELKYIHPPLWMYFFSAVVFVLAMSGLWFERKKARA